MTDSSGNESERPIVFISCGQYEEHEKRLGNDIAQLINEHTPCHGYFAQNKSSLEGLSRHILGALNDCVGLIAVMHHRGTVQTLNSEHTRGSVWVEQEIAIAAFLQQAQGRDLDVALYIQRGIKREGVREQLLLNPKVFDENKEVVEDLRKRIENDLFSSPSRYPVNLTASIGYNIVRQDANDHRYQLNLAMKNEGKVVVESYYVELLFPKAALYGPPGTIGGELIERRTATHSLFRVTSDKLRKKLYPGDTINFMKIPYWMNDDLLSDRQLMAAKVSLTIHSKGMKSKTIERPFTDLQNF